MTKLESAVQTIEHGLLPITKSKEHPAKKMGTPAALEAAAQWKPPATNVPSDDIDGYV